jgi:hypothetical protein
MPGSDGHLRMLHVPPHVADVRPHSHGWCVAASWACMRQHSGIWVWHSLTLRLLRTWNAGRLSAPWQVSAALWDVSALSCSFRRRCNNDKNACLSTCGVAAVFRDRSLGTS